MPNEWKHANVIPVYKGKGNRHKVNNYRPISLTSTICKVVETYLYDKLPKHWSKFNNNLSNMVLEKIIQQLFFYKN